ncbi:MAG: DUF5320 domain-containing protein [Syntrophobacterales bacterium]|nr:DUF5320 domain-containing protein [Syntrophobacterales bacterium]
MPWGDRTGPMGYGPMTGRGAGYCAGYQMPGFANPTPGRGFWGGVYPGMPALAYSQTYPSYGQAGYYGGFGRSFGFGRGIGRGWSGRPRGMGRGRFMYGW